MSTAFSLLSQQEEVALICNSKIRSYKKGDIIFTAGQSVDEVYYVLSGWINVFKENSQGKQISVGLRYNGHFIGVSSIISNTDRGCSCQALIDSDLIIIPRKEFLKLVSNNNEFSNHILNLLAHRLCDTQNKMISFITNQTKNRLVLILLDIIKYLSSGKSDKRFLNMKISQETLAHLVGCSRQTINTILNSLRAEGSLEIQGRKLLWLSYDKLSTYIKD